MKHFLLLPLLLGTVAQVAAGQTAAEYAARHPDQLQDSVIGLMRAGMDEPARALAAAHQASWGNSFLVQRVAWIGSLTPEARGLFSSADSLRLLGNRDFFRTGPLVSRRSWTHALELFRSIGDSVGVTVTTANLGASYYEEGRLDSASVMLERARLSAERLGDLRTAGNASTILANVAWERGDLVRALELNARAAEFFLAYGSYRGTAAARNNAGMIAVELGDHESAGRHFREAIAVSRSHLGGERSADYLVNLGSSAQERGRTAEAIDFYSQALDAYRTSNESVNEALVLTNLGMLYASVGSYAAAREMYGRALELRRAAGMERDVAEIHRLLASLALVDGRVEEAVRFIDSANELTRRITPPDRELLAGIAVVSGDIALALNDAESASAAYERALDLYIATGNQEGRTAAALGVAQAELALDRADRAAVSLEASLAAQTPPRDRAWTLLLLGMASRETADSSNSRTYLQDARSLFASISDRAGEALAAGELGSADARQGLLQNAKQHYREALALAAGLPQVEWRIHFGTGRTLERGRDFTGALASYSRAVELIESEAAVVIRGDRRASFMADKWEAYGALAELQARIGLVDEAFVTSERLRARYMLDMFGRRASLGASAGSLAARRGEIADSISRMTSRLALAEDGTRGVSETDAGVLGEGLRSARARYLELNDEIMELAPEYLRSFTGHFSGPQEVQANLGSHQVFIEYLVLEDRVRIFAITHNTVRDFAVDVDRGSLRSQIDFARWAIESEPEREELWAPPLVRLERLLLGPVRDAGILDDATTVIVAPHRELHYLPFEALIDTTGSRPRYVVETHDVAYVASASVWLTAALRAPVDGGVTAFAPLEAALPGTGAEADAVRRRWSASTILRRSDATETRFASTSGARIVHLATRAILDRHNPLLSYVELAPGEGQDGRLEVHEIYGLELEADLLVLSACQTALGSGTRSDVPNGDDWVGFVRAFFHAGARNLLATLWAIDDRRTATFMADFHNLLADDSDYWRALAATKRRAIQNPELSSPYFWAGFVMFGSRF